MIALNITPEEVEQGSLSVEHLDAAIRAMNEDGFVVLKNIVDLSHLDTLKAKMLEDVEKVMAREDAPFNFNTGNLQQDPPPFPPYLFKDVLLNPLVINVTRTLLGPGVTNAYYSGNTALPGGDRQPVHPDTAQLWPNLEVPTPPFGCVVNVPVVDMSEANGSTELWPGTHNDTTFTIYNGSIRIPEEVLEKRRSVRPPIQPTVERGSVVIRDIRLWHAGMPNRTDEPRPMIAMIHWTSWWGHKEKLSFPKGAEEFFQGSDLRTNAEFVDGPIDYIRHNQAYDFQK